jgi:hypothetical protein
VHYAKQYIKFGLSWRFYTLGSKPNRGFRALNVTTFCL